jgi:5-oxoprolinase (ATP-hydrolysing) subunit A
MHRIDFNCDMGEGYGAWRMGDDVALLDHVTSANVACGFHAGDPATIRRTVSAAVEKEVAVGAHPSLPDLQGFGRRAMHISPAEVYDITVYQVGAVAAFARACGGRLSHVKAHGALYNMAAKDRALADAIAAAVRDVDSSLVLFALSGSELMAAAQATGVTAAAEVFADRSYQDDGSLTPRGRPGAMIEEVEISIEQVKRMVLDGIVRAQSGKEVPVRADTLCIHGDQPGALEFAKRIRAALVQAGVEIRAIRA